MKLSYAARALFVSASLVACAVHGADDEKASSSTNAISGSIDTQRECAAAATYTSDGPNDFDTPADNKLSAGLRKSIASDAVSHFKAPSVGDVYADGSGATAVSLFDVNGKLLAFGQDDGTGTLAWWTANDTPLDCSHTSYNVKAGSMNSSSGGSSSGWSSSGTVSGDGGISGDDDDSTEDGGVAFEDGGTTATADAGAHH